MIQVNLTWVYLTQYVPFTGFLNLLTVYSLNHPAALFHATSTYGVHPTEFSPWKQHCPFVRVSYLASMVLFLPLHPPAWKQLDSWNTHSKRFVRLNKHHRIKVLIHLQVRSHLALVLPATSGRYSLGVLFFCLLGIYHKDPSENRYPLMCLSIILQAKLHSHFRVLRIFTKDSLRRENQPLIGFGPFFCNSFKWFI
jgi:hypothetical protein